MLDFTTYPRKSRAPSIGQVLNYPEGRSIVIRPLHNFLHLLVHLLLRLLLRSLPFRGSMIDRRNHYQSQSLAEIRNQSIPLRYNLEIKIILRIISPLSPSPSLRAITNSSQTRK